ncbi:MULTISPECIES: phospholipase A [Microbulbifer]|uniref:phospholipase A n=1 Tax=Microbulbifer TaxID=48073 RepID=UPI001F15A3AC|nr:phospholipase A [Microbulbifer zhoushanensis]
MEVQDLPEPSTDVAGPPARAPASDRVEAVREAARNRFSLASHKVNYVLPASYNDALSTEPGPRGQAYRDLEMQFQLSVQVPLWSGFLGKSSFVSLAYTNRSFWQAYSSSAPFREVNHEPELIMTWLSDWDFLGFQCVASQLGVSHQSNGRGDEFSRGWNRVYTNFMFERGDLFLNFQPWYRLPEDEIGDDNPDIEFYIGNFQLHGGYRAASHSASFVLRNNLRSDNRGSVELRWSFPIGGRVHGFVRYFNGYGDTLLDYNREQESLGLGIELARGL